MSQTFNNIPASTKLKDSLADILARDEALRTTFSGTSFPSSQPIGCKCYRTDETKWYMLTSTGPDVWTQIPLGVPVPINQGGTNATSAAAALANLGGVSAASPSFTGTVDVTEAIKLSGDISPSQITANQDNYAPTGFATAAVLRINSDASGRTITGIAGGADGRVIVILNVGSFPIVFSNESASSSAANRMALGSNVIVPAGSALTLLYDSTSSRWRFVAGPSTGEVTQTLTDGATINWDVSSGNIAKVTLGGNRTFAAPSNLKDGSYILHVIQDGTGSRTITWNAAFKWVGGVAPVLSTTAGARDVFSFTVENGVLYGGMMKGMA